MLKCLIIVCIAIKLCRIINPNEKTERIKNINLMNRTPNFYLIGINFPAIDGVWGEWSSWSTPVEGTTKVKRTRKCANPKPQYGGKQCVGSGEELVDVVLRK